MRILWVYLISSAITLSLGLINERPPTSADGDIKFSALKHSPDYSELIVRSEGVFGLQRTAEDGSSSLRLYELTDGLTLTQLVFSPMDTLVDCDVSNTAKLIRRLVKHVSSKHLRKDQYANIELEDEEFERLTSLDQWIDVCNSLHTQILENKLTSKQDTNITNGSSIDSSELQPQQETRRKRGLLDEMLIYPGIFPQQCH